MRKYPIHVKKNYDKQFTTVTTHKNVKNYYNEICTYNVKTHCNLLYSLKVWNCLNYSKERTNFFYLIKLLFIKVRRLINVNVGLEANLEGQGW